MFILELKKKALKIIIKKSSENDQTTGHFQSFFFPRHPDPRYEKNTLKSTNKNLAYSYFKTGLDKQKFSA